MNRRAVVGGVAVLGVVLPRVVGLVGDVDPPARSISGAPQSGV